MASLALTFAAVGHAADKPSDSGRPIEIGRSYVIPSQILGGKRTINVYLPPGYSDAKRSFPVLYLLDGGAAEDFHHITGLAQVVAFNGRTQELIVVGIEGVDRKHDLTSGLIQSPTREVIPLGPTGEVRCASWDEVARAALG